MSHNDDKPGIAAYITFFLIICMFEFLCFSAFTESLEALKSGISLGPILGLVGSSLEGVLFLWGFCYVVYRNMVGDTCSKASPVAAFLGECLLFIPLLLGHIYWSAHSIDVYRAIPKDIGSGTNYCLVCEEIPQRVVEVEHISDGSTNYVTTCVKCGTAVKTKRFSMFMACLSNILLPFHFFLWGWMTRKTLIDQE